MAPSDNDKTKKPTFEAHEFEKMDPKEADAEMEKFFAELEKKMQGVPEEVVKAGAQKVVDLIKGKLSWSEIFNITPEMMKQMVELGYLKFQAGRLEEAERFFKVLCVLDSRNHYFRSMLGSILQRQKRYAEAIVQYTEALGLNPNDIVSIVNRGEIYLQHGWIPDAEADFKKAISLDPNKEDKWADRARVLLNQITEIRKRRKALEEEAKKNAKAKKKGKKK